MDAAALFETTVLHEMTHSKAVGIPQVDMGIGEVYGWAGIVDVQSPNNSGMWSPSSRYHQVIAMKLSSIQTVGIRSVFMMYIDSNKIYSWNRYFGILCAGGLSHPASL